MKDNKRKVFIIALCELFGCADICLAWLLSDRVKNLGLKEVSLGALGAFRAVVRH
jgi:hypothetical protein